MDKGFVILLAMVIVNIVDSIQESPSVLYRNADENVGITEDLSREAVIEIETEEEVLEPLERDGDLESAKEELKTADIEKNQEDSEAVRSVEKTAEDEERAETDKTQRTSKVNNLDAQVRASKERNENIDDVRKSGTSEERTALEHGDDMVEATVHTKGRTGRPSGEVNYISAENTNFKLPPILKPVSNLNPIGLPNFNPNNLVAYGNRFQNLPNLPPPILQPLKLPIPYNLLNKRSNQDIGSNQLSTEVSRSDSELPKDNRMEKYDPNTNAYPYEPVARTSRPFVEAVTSFPLLKPLTFLPQIETVTVPAPPKFDLKPTWQPLPTPFFKDNIFPENVFANSLPKNFNPYPFNLNTFVVNKRFG